MGTKRIVITKEEQELNKLHQDAIKLEEIGVEINELKEYVDNLYKEDNLSSSDSNLSVLPNEYTKDDENKTRD